MWLTRHNVPFDVAFQMDDLVREALCIIASEQGGGKFDWSTMQFEDPE